MKQAECDLGRYQSIYTGRIGEVNLAELLVFPLPIRVPVSSVPVLPRKDGPPSSAAGGRPPISHIRTPTQSLLHPARLNCKTQNLHSSHSTEIVFRAIDEPYLGRTH
ncbi:hypothetical protein FRC20_000485 [Serendipita sp. 405]|nr:hypothetical protein FRC20_000485 [Serendipita sp. 405]